MKHRPIPADGIVGAAALREAFTGDYQMRIELVRAALRNPWKMAGDDDPWPYVRAVYDDAIVAERDGKLLRYAYTIGEGDAVSFGSPILVEQRYVPVDAAGGAALREAFVECSAFVEGGKQAGRFHVRVIRAGLSGNANYYPDAVLREAVPLFADARVFAKSDAEHLAGAGKDFRNLIGRLAEPRFVEGARGDEGAIHATLELIEPEGAIGVKLREAVARGMAGLFGLSVDVSGPARTRTAGGRTFREAVKFVRVASVDLIVEPGAGGAVINFTEAKGEPDMLRAKLIATITEKRPALLAGIDVETLTDDEVEAKYREALAPAPTSPAAPPAGVTAEQLAETVRMVEAKSYARTTIAASTLPAPAKERLTTRFGELQSFREADVDAAIKAERDYLGKFVRSGRVEGLGDSIRIEGGESQREKHARMIEAFFDPAHKDHRDARSIREIYVSMTGDRKVTGQLAHCDEAIMRESLASGSWSSVLASTINRRLVAEYRLGTVFDVWRPIVSVVPIGDFRNQERVRFGGYGNLPAVEQGAPYTALTSPTDEKASYAVTKRGGTEDITIEMIKNDDVGAVQRIPTSLSRSAKRTLSEFVLDFIRSNPTIFDSVALFHADHGNLGSAALDATSFAAARLAMLKQTEKNSSKRLGIGPKYILVPADLEAAAHDIFRRSTNQDKTFIQSLTPTILPVWYWSDANDWALAADPLDVPTIEVGFLDGNEEPELFVQDNPTVGSLFTNDKITTKIRHIYGAVVVDFRGLYKAVVT